MGRSWIRSYFIDHPLLASKHPQAYSNSQRDKPKVFCRECWNWYFSEEQQRDQADIAAGKRRGPRSQSEIETYLWSYSLGDENVKWIQCRADTLLRHIRHCPRQNQEVRQTIYAEMMKRGMFKGKGKQRTFDEMEDEPEAPHFPLRIDPTLAQSSSSSFSSTPSTGVPLVSQDLPGSMSSLPQTLSPLYSASPSNSLPSTPFPISPLITLDPSLSHIDHASQLPFAKHPRLSSRPSSRNLSRHPSQNLPVWTPEFQREFATHLARITASCGFPFIWVENPEWIAFCARFVPGSEPISRRSLANHWIPTVAAKIREETMKKTNGQQATLQCDGWSGINFHHFIAFMITTSRREVHTVHVHDASSERKKAENLVEIILQVKDKLENQWHVILIALTSDAGGESRKARRLIHRRFPALVTPDCYGHQIHLISSDYFKALEAVLLAMSKKADGLISWLRSKTQLLGIMRDLQNAVHATNPATTGQVLSVIRAVLTRWTAHYLAYKRLLDLKWVLETMVYRDEALPPEQRRIPAPDAKADARAKAFEMIAVIKDPLFWHSLARMKKHLEPLAHASCIAQTAHCRLDEVLLILGSLYVDYQQLINEDHDERTAIQPILDSIEKRWESLKHDRDVFVAAVILNPFHKIAPFAQMPLFSRSAIFGLLRRLWIRFYGESTLSESSLYDEVNNYMDNEGPYTNMMIYARDYERRAREKGQSPDPLQIYQGLVYGPDDDASRPPLQRLARRILTICANSASCERLFSMFGITLTRLRSRLRPQAMTDLAELRMHLRDEHLKAGSVKERYKRKITSHSASNSQANNNRDPESSTNSNAQIGSNLAQGSATESEVDEVRDVSSESSFASLIGNITARAEEDDDDEPDIPLADLTLRPINARISELFDLKNDYWKAPLKDACIRSLAEELELYELVDLDAEGEVDNMAGGENDIIQASL